MYVLHGTRGHFPTEESIYFTARGPTVITLLIVMKYYCCGEDRRENKWVSRLKIKHTLTVLLMMLCKHISLIRTAWISLTYTGLKN